MQPFRLSLLGIAACFAGAGCGDSGSRIFHVSGTVTFDGQPVPAGRIDFFPDLATGNDGAQGFALIKGGSFDTRLDGQGHAGGAMVIRIEGFDGKSEDPRFFGAPIFKTYELKLEMPKESGQQDFAVPASAAKGLVKGEKPRS